MSKWVPTGLGAEPKKVIFLIGLLASSPVVYWYSNSTDTPITAPSAAKRATLPIVEPAVIARPTPKAANRTTRGGNDDFHPTLKLPDGFDLSKVDPTLRTDLLVRVREIGEVGGSRSLFEFYTPPPPPPPVADIKPTKPKPDPFAEAAKQAAAAKQTPPPPPPPPPIPLKYSGYEGTPNGGSKLRGVFVDGEEHFLARVNDMLKNRYRIVRIGTTSAEVEDTVAKNTQTLRIADRCEDVCK